MDRTLKILLLYFMLIIAKVKCEDLIEEINDKVTVTTTNSAVTVTMDENNHDFNETNLAHVPLFKINHNSPTLIWVVNNFEYSIEVNPDDSSSTIFYATQSFDYETQESRYVFNIRAGDELPLVTLIINNIDDEAPSLSPPVCSFDENTIYTADDSPCASTVTDPDGWLSQMSFEIIDNGHDESITFALEYRDKPEDNVYSADVYMTVNVELNYQNIVFYLFNIRATDGAGHATSPNELVRGIVNVNDLPDTPPEWTIFFTSQQFEEQSVQIFHVTAIDGDYGLNWEINYRKLWEDDEDANYISIDNDGEIIVTNIDRDKDDISMYRFAIEAYKALDPTFATPLNITFFITDIDNNPPLVRWVEDAEKTNVTYDGSEADKSTKVSFLENYAGNLNVTIFIRDIDTGENAQFTVELENLETNEIDYTQAFLVVPTSGYRTGQFQISVRDASFLDYEIPEWIHITFNVLTKGWLDETKEDRILVDITLIDYNDELPIFPEEEYSVEINETAKIDTFITQILATDRDAEDIILSHTLLGSTYTNRVLRIDSDTGDIYVNADNAFDYDTVNPIFVQVRATDKANHSTTAPLTINLLDVNNKAPTITVGDPINVDENQMSSTYLNASITASDMDTTADLSADIDWDRSYAMKNSRRLDMTNDTISQQVKFLDVEWHRVSDDDSNLDIEINLIVNSNNPDNTTPDFELFDSLYLFLVVTDWNTDPEFLDNRQTSTFILISINDINDNTPYFPEANLPEDQRENRTVQEYAPQGTSVSSIAAIDLDVDDDVTYNCEAENPDFDWVDVNYNTGAFTVKASNLIDADVPPTFYFNYTCTASDTGNAHTSDPLTVRFYIIDTNNKPPDITIDNVVYVDEKSAALTPVSDIGTEDLDRDIPFHTVQCTLDRDATCGDKFVIYDNVVQVRNGHNDINRDTGVPNFTCPMTCQDNPDRLQNDQNPHSVAITFIIVLNDINDNTPEVTTTNIVTTEDINEGDIIDIILATDIDAGDNAEIDFNVANVVNADGENVPNLFAVVPDDDYFVNLTFKQTNLVALQDLRGWHGVYTLTIEVADRGTPPNTAEYEVTVEVNRYNFEAPRFIVPPPDGESYILLSSQTMYSQLILLTNDANYLPDFYASDNTESDECEKWDLEITVEQVEPEDEDSIFIISKTDKCKGQLQVNNHFNPEAVLLKSYKLKLTASITDGEQQEGEAPYTITTAITVSFLDNNQKPIFDCYEMEFSFIEEKIDQTQELKCTATYAIPDPSLPIIYFLYPEKGNEIADETFTVDSSTGEISLLQKISYKENEVLNFRIVASNDSNSESSDIRSFLNVTCNVIEINNNAPVFKRDNFFGAVMAGYTRNTPVVTVEATDADKIDQDVLTYAIDGEITSVGSGLSTVPDEAFLINSNTGEIRLNFQVDSAMSGYFKFDVTVSDIADQFGNGPYSTTTSVTVFIITSDNTVDFRFYNTIEEVQTKEDEMLEIVSGVLGSDAYKQNIDKSTQDGIELDDQTVASLYFINATTVQAIAATSILKAVSSISTFSQLSAELRNQTGLILMSFQTSNSSSENLEEVLKAWLVGVSVVLGALCLILLVTFILKTRELNNRIKNLTTNKFGSQESGLNRLGISAPTTNKHAVEGSNPIFNHNSSEEKRDLSKFDDFDKNSIRSGDSDLIGIEDSPEFDYNPENSQHI